MNSKWQITQEIKNLPKLDKPILIEGLPGIGNVGKIVVDFLIEELKAKKLYSFFSYKFPHSVFVGEDNLVEMPKIEIYYKKFNDKKKKDLLLLVGDIQPIDEESCYTFCDEILMISKKFNCAEIITTGGIGLQNVPDKPKVYCTANNLSLFKTYINKKKLVEKNIFGVVGPIIGVSGVLLGLGKRQNIKGVSLLAETFSNPLFLGIKGAQEILKVLNIRFKFSLNLQKINKEIVEVEKELMTRTKEWFSEMKSSSQAGAKVRNKEIDYIG